MAGLAKLWPGPVTLDQTKPWTGEARSQRKLGTWGKYELSWEGDHGGREGGHGSRRMLGLGRDFSSG